MVENVRARRELNGIVWIRKGVEENKRARKIRMYVNAGRSIVRGKASVFPIKIRTIQRETWFLVSTP
jgi:hypothetical protein